jgi:ribonuclease-3
MAQLRERCVKNETLAQYACIYNFDKRVTLPRDYKNLTKIHGDVFEAYVGAIILSDPEHGFEQVAKWMKGLWAGTLMADIKTECNRAASRPTNSVSSKSTSSSGKPIDLDTLPSKDRLQAMIGCRGLKIYYKENGPEKKDRHSGLPLFSQACYLDDAEEGKMGQQLGFGTALSKKEAGQKAAEMAMSNGKIMKKYGERKKRIDEVSKIFMSVTDETNLSAPNLGDCMQNEVLIPVL